MKENALFDALYAGDIKSLKKMLNMRQGLFWGPYVYNVHIFSQGRSLLDVAVEKGERFAELVWHALLKRHEKNKSFWYNIKEVLMYSISTQDVPMVSFLLRQNTIKKYNRVMPKSEHVFADDLLRHAISVERYDRQIVWALLECGLNFNDPVVINSIVSQNDIDTVQRLIDDGVDIGRYVDLRHVVHCSDKLIFLLLDNGAKIGTGPSDVVELLSNIKSVPVIKRLCEMGIDINEQDEYGNTAILLTKSPQVFQYLLDNGAKTDVVNDDGDTIWMNAAQNHEMTEACLKHGLNAKGLANTETNETALMIAASSCSLAAQMLLDSEADVNAQDNEGYTALMLAAYPRITDMLIKANADVNIQNNAGQTALMLSNCLEETKLLLGAKADVNLVDNEGTPAIMFEFSLSELKLLIKARADVNIQDNAGTSLLMTAKNMHEAKIFLAAGAKVDLADKNGNLPLHHMVAHGDFETVRLLLSNGSPVSVPNADEDTPLMIARRLKKKNAARIITLLEPYEQTHGCQLVASRKCPMNLSGVPVHTMG